MARALASEGARVALLARDARALEGAAREIGGHALALPADVGDPAAVRDAFARLERAFAGLDLLVNNAGLGRPARIEDADDADLRAQLDTNLLGAIHCCRAAIPLLRRAGGGQIVNVSSDAALAPWPLLAVYAATKAGLELFTRALRSELAPDGIRVALLRAGPSLTTFASGWAPEAASAAFAAWSAAGLLPAAPLAPERLAEALLFAVTRPAGAGVLEVDVRP
jgi:NAD(P)-dependent dehydrogenase (short-subunit alcohol dehydrogenase family)